MAGGQAGEAQRDFHSEIIIQDKKLKPKASVVESPEDLRHKKIRLKKNKQTLNNNRMEPITNLE